MDNANLPASSATSPAPRRAKPTFSAGHYVILVALVGIGLLVLTDNVRPFFRYLYSPFSISLLIIIGAMNLLQKGSDRSRIYRIELREMRRRRLEDLQFCRQIERDLASIAERLEMDDIRDNESAASPSAERLRDIRKELEDTLDRLRDRN